jgi:hypothetical protein
MTNSANKLIMLSSACASSSCPTVYLAENGMLVVQGYSTPLETPEGESAVKIPASVVREAIGQLAIHSSQPS